MNKFIIALTFTLLSTFSASTFAQKSSKEIKGDKYYSYYSYDDAIESYLQVKDLSMEGQRKLAESFHYRDRNKEAEEIYSKFINNTQGVEPDDYYNFAMVLKTNAKYGEAAKWMDKFKELRPNDLRAKNYAEDNSKLTNLQKDEGKYKVVHLDINTDAEDFGPSYYKNKIVFASSRQAGTQLVKREYNWNKKPFLDLYVADKSGDQLVNPVAFDKVLNGKWHDGPGSFANEGNFVAFTRNNYTNESKDGIVKLEIYFSTYKDGKWSEPESFYLNNSEYSVEHPYLLSDGNTMYFASDMPGGFGGADLYVVSKDSTGKWGKPTNLGNKVNTEGNEGFPYFEETLNMLIFSSNGFLGLGGLDLFFTSLKEDGTWGKVRNFGNPINTQYDDFAMIMDYKGSKGYFSSNRSGGSGDDDIYSFDLLKRMDIGKKIAGVSKDKDGNVLPRTFIQLLDPNGNVIDTITTKEDGKYVFNVQEDGNYKLIGTKDKYTKGDSTVNTVGSDYIVRADVFLQKTPEKKIDIGSDLGKILELNPIYFDLDKFNIRPDAAAELDKIVKIMNQYPNMVIELGSHTDCRASKAYNQSLSDRRAKASAQYIKEKISKPERIYGKGYGETRLLNGCACEGAVQSNCSEEEHQKNRRTEFVVIKK